MSGLAARRLMPCFTTEKGFFYSLNARVSDFYRRRQLIAGRCSKGAPQSIKKVALVLRVDTAKQSNVPLALRIANGASGTDSAWIYCAGGATVAPWMACSVKALAMNSLAFISSMKSAR